MHVEMPASPLPVRLDQNYCDAIVHANPEKSDFLQGVSLA